MDFNTGAQWHMLPQSYPNYKTVHRRFQTWCSNEILRLVLTDVANELRENGALDEEECLIDATFVIAKGGGSEIGPTKRGKGMKIWRSVAGLLNVKNAVLKSSVKLSIFRAIEGRPLLLSR